MRPSMSLSPTTGVVVVLATWLRADCADALVKARAPAVATAAMAAVNDLVRGRRAAVDGMDTPGQDVRVSTRSTPRARWRLTAARPS